MWIRTCPHRPACPPFKLPGKQQATIHSLKQAMIEQLATSIRTKKTKLDRQLGIQKTSPECVRRHNKNINREPTINAQGPDPRRPKIHGKLLQQKRMLKNKAKFLMISCHFPYLMYRRSHLLFGPGYWISMSPALILQLYFLSDPRLVQLCFLCKR